MSFHDWYWEFSFAVQFTLCTIWGNEEVEMVEEEKKVYNYLLNMLVISMKCCQNPEFTIENDLLAVGTVPERQI